MAITLSEKLLTLSEARARLPGRPDMSTLWRWYQRGVRGVRLETVVVGARRYTSAEALERFLSASTAAADGMQSRPAAVSAARQRQIAAAEARCAAAGI